MSVPSVGAKLVVDWVRAHRSDLHFPTGATPAAVDFVNLNIPTCRAGKIRGVRTAPLATEGTDATAPADCRSTVTTTPTFATHWLAGRIGRFQLAAPHIAVRMIANFELADFARDSVDVAIRYGTAGQRGLALPFSSMMEEGQVDAVCLALAETIR